jgi:hypothetical protein
LIYHKVEVKSLIFVSWRVFRFSPVNNDELQTYLRENNLITALAMESSVIVQELFSEKTREELTCHYCMNRYTGREISSINKFLHLL